MQKRGIDVENRKPATVRLRDGSTINYERAVVFMDWYCKRYNFSPPVNEFTQAMIRVNKRKIYNWECVMSVGGRKIGMGKGVDKKASRIDCYLDVVKYLESCDGKLWQDFLQVSPEKKQTAQAPHLLFQVSQNIREDVQSLCRDIQSSTLLKQAPPPDMTNEDQPEKSSYVPRPSAPQNLEAKSKALLEKLKRYETSFEHQAMRAQRASLPITSRGEDIMRQIEENDVTVIVAATGSGKTTQIPQIILDHAIKKGNGSMCNVMCTQPRRLAATSVAERIADERGDRLGNEVGYQVRFDMKAPKPNGSITFCTTGIFLKKMQSSFGTEAHVNAVHEMDQISHIVVDEVHERDIDTDLSLVVLKRLLASRKERGIPLKVILMSATIDPTLFQQYFADSNGELAPVIDVPGRTFPVTRHWLGETVAELRKDWASAWVFQDKTVHDYLEKELSTNASYFGPNTGMNLMLPYPLVALYIAHVLSKSDDGHVLVFLPGWEDIKKVAELLRGGKPLLDINLGDQSKYSIHYLHSSIPAAEQRQVFQPPPRGVRRIILATNIAETSVTIPDVVYVVDTGRVKESRYDATQHLTSLVSAWVGASNLNQRAGRAGRHREGEYYGMISDLRRDSLDSHQMVEMKRSDLSNVVMHVKVRLDLRSVTCS